MTPQRIQVIPGGVECNCYVELVEANRYFASVGRSDEWSAFSPAQQAAALLAATRQIERLPLRGRRADPATPQALHFPRVEDPDALVEGLAFLALLDRPVKLPHRVVMPCTETVHTVDGEQVFRPWADYILDCVNGAIVARSGGQMAHRSPYAISYLCREVPESVRHATCEHALWLLAEKGAPTTGPHPPDSMMWSDVVGAASSPAPSEGDTQRLSRRGWSPVAARLLRPYVEPARVG